MCFLVFAASLFASGILYAQKPQSQPATDSSAQASPIASPPKVTPTDDSAQASPVPPEQRHGGPIAPPHTALRVTLVEGIDSGHLKNGQMVHARLSQAVVTGTRSRTLPAGTPAVLTVIGTVPAGKINAVGEVSLQLVRLGGTPVYTDILTFRGKPGHKDLPDSAPAVGTDAGLPSGAALVFHVQPPPTAADDAPAQHGVSPGSVNGIAVGDAPPANGNSSGQQTGPANGTGSIPSGRTPAIQAPGANVPGPAQNAGETSVAPNQPSTPVSPTGTSRPQ